MNGIIDQPTTPRSLKAAATIAALIVILTALIAPYAGRPLGVIQPFLPMFAMAVFLLENLTAYLLFTQFRSTQEPFLAALSGAYGYVGIMVAIQILVFPGVFSETGWLGANPQSAVWIWALWHGGFPTIVLLALPLRMPRIGRIRKRALRRVGVVLMVAAPLLALLLAAVAINWHGLPQLIDGVSYFTLGHSMAGQFVLLVNLLALLVCLYLSRLRDLLSLWLSLVLISYLADVTLTILASARYSVGWYAARALSALSSSMVLGVLIWEISQLYGQLSKAHIVLTERAVRDGLTGAFNRGHFSEQFPREVLRAQNEQTALSLLMIDADHFKAYNDTFGHPQGDRCLIALVGVIQSVIRRPTDQLARYGGEEFAVTLPGADARAALRVAQAIRQGVAALRLPGAHPGSPFVTVSIGIATLDIEDASLGPEELIRRADLALYQAKRGGRDTARSFDEVLVAGVVT